MRCGPKGYLRAVVGARTRRALRLPHCKHVAFVLDPHAPVAAYKLLAGDGKHELGVRGSVSEEPRAGAVVEPSNDDALLRLALPVEDDGVSFDRRIAFGPLDERRALGCVDLSWSTAGSVRRQSPSGGRE